MITYPVGATLSDDVGMLRYRCAIPERACSTCMYGDYDHDHNCAACDSCEGEEGSNWAPEGMGMDDRLRLQRVLDLLELLTAIHPVREVTP